MRRSDIDCEYERVAAALRKRELRGVRLPALYQKPGEGGGGYTVCGLMLVFFASRLGRVASKDELVAFLRAHRCRTNDPQPRHMGMQLGLNFLVNGCWRPRLRRALRRGEYCLLDLRNAHPAHATMHRAKAERLDFGGLKRLYCGRCACCGSQEGQPHLKNALLLTALEQGHCDPRRPLSGANCIPMCSMCNMVYKDHAVLSKRGFVVTWLKPGAADSADSAAADSAAADSAGAHPSATAGSRESGAAPPRDEAARANGPPPEPDATGARGVVAALAGGLAAAAAGLWRSLRCWLRGGTQAASPRGQGQMHGDARRRSRVFFGGGPMSLLD
jgi:hypothetical protein